MVVAEWPPHPYLDPWAFLSYFLPPFCWGGEGRERLGGCSVASQGQPTAKVCEKEGEVKNAFSDIYCLIQFKKKKKKESALYINKTYLVPFWYTVSKLFSRLTRKIALLSRLRNISKWTDAQYPIIQTNSNLESMYHCEQIEYEFSIDSWNNKLESFEHYHLCS